MIRRSTNGLPLLRNMAEFKREDADLERAFEESQLPEGASAQAALNDLLVRLRLGRR